MLLWYSHGPVCTLTASLVHSMELTSTIGTASTRQVRLRCSFSVTYNVSPSDSDPVECWIVNTGASGSKTTTWEHKTVPVRCHIITYCTSISHDYTTLYEYVTMSHVNRAVRGCFNDQNIKYTNTLVIYTWSQRLHWTITSKSASVVPTSLVARQVYGPASDGCIDVNWCVLPVPKNPQNDGTTL